MEKFKSETAIRCAKAAILLSSLKCSSYDSVTNDASQSQDAENLKMENLKLRLKIRKLVKEKQEVKLRMKIGMIVHFVCLVILLCNIVNCL